jgi:tRNA (mo5U34)-methyltransferase
MFQPPVENCNQRRLVGLLVNNSNMRCVYFLIMGEDLLNETDLVHRIQSLPWFHSIDLGNGLVTPGRARLDDLKAMADVMFDEALTGKTILDIGCYDGFYSFEAHRRGAKRVVATDHFIWRDPRCRECFELARDIIAPGMEVHDLDIPDLTPDRIGTFDLVVFAGVLYHLRHPFQTLERISPLARETLVVETHLDAIESRRPAMTFYPGSELNNDPSNWWGPNRACVEAMLQDVGFPFVTFRPNPVHPDRGIFHARRRP